MMIWCRKCKESCICRKCVRECKCKDNPGEPKSVCADFLDLFDYLDMEDDEDAGD